MLSRFSIRIVNLKFTESFQFAPDCGVSKHFHSAQNRAARTLVLVCTKSSVPQALINVAQSILFKNYPDYAKIVCKLVVFMI